MRRPLVLDIAAHGELSSRDSQHGRLYRGARSRRDRACRRPDFSCGAPGLYRPTLGDYQLLVYLQPLGIRDSVDLLESLDCNPVLLGDGTQSVAGLNHMDHRRGGR